MSLSANQIKFLCVCVKKESIADVTTELINESLKKYQDTYDQNRKESLVPKIHFLEKAAKMDPSRFVNEDVLKLEIQAVYQLTVASGIEPSAAVDDLCDKTKYAYCYVYSKDEISNIVKEQLDSTERLSADFMETIEIIANDQSLSDQNSVLLQELIDSHVSIDNYEQYITEKRDACKTARRSGQPKEEEELIELWASKILPELEGADPEKKKAIIGFLSCPYLSNLLRPGSDFAGNGSLFQAVIKASVKATGKSEKEIRKIILDIAPFLAINMEDAQRQKAEERNHSAQVSLSRGMRLISELPSRLNETSERMKNLLLQLKEIVPPLKDLEEQMDELQDQFSDIRSDVEFLTMHQDDEEYLEVYDDFGARVQKIIQRFKKQEDILSQAINRLEQCRYAVYQTAEKFCIYVNEHGHEIVAMENNYNELVAAYNFCVDYMQEKEKSKSKAKKMYALLCGILNEKNSDYMKMLKDTAGYREKLAMHLLDTKTGHDLEECGGMHVLTIMNTMHQTTEKVIEQLPKLESVFGPCKTKTHNKTDQAKKILLVILAIVVLILGITGKF